MQTDTLDTQQETVNAKSAFQNELEFERALDKLRHALSEAQLGIDSIGDLLQAAAKHFPIYVKVLKSHLLQLQSDLGLTSLDPQHHLAEPLQQLMALFSQLNEADLNQLEWLVRESQLRLSNYADSHSTNNTQSDPLTALL